MVQKIHRMICNQQSSMLGHHPGKGPSVHPKAPSSSQGYWQSSYVQHQGWWYAMGPAWKTKPYSQGHVTTSQWNMAFHPRDHSHPRSPWMVDRLTSCQWGIFHFHLGFIPSQTSNINLDCCNRPWISLPDNLVKKLNLMARIISSKSSPGWPARQRWHTPPPAFFELAALGPFLKVRVRFPADAWEGRNQSKAVLNTYHFALYRSIKIGIYGKAKLTN